MADFSPPVPVLRSFDEHRARRFYVDFLGFQVQFEHRFEDGAPLYMGLRRDDCVIHLSEHYGDATPGSTLRIEVADVAALAASLRAQDFENARPGEPTPTDWGTRELVVQDPASNRLVFFTMLDD